MKYFLLFIVFFLFIFLETQIQLPFALLLLIALTTATKQQWLFFVAVGAGILLDGLLFRPIGMTSFFFLLVLLFIYLYQQKFEIQTIQFTAFATCIASFLYLLLFGSTAIILQILVSIVFVLPLFLIAKKFALPR